MPTPCARSLNIFQRCSLLFPPMLRAVLTKNPKTRNTKAETGSIFGREKARRQTLECSWRKPVKDTWTLKWRFLQGACRSFIPVPNFHFLMRQGSETLLSQKRGRAHATRMVAPEDLVEVFRLAHCSAFALSTCLMVPMLLFSSH